MPEERCISCGRKVPWFAFFGNLMLTIFKVVVGALGGSNALIADGLHSFTDVIGTGVILASCRISGRPADARHPYGHGKAEFMSASFIYIVLLVLAAIIFVGGATVIYNWSMRVPSILTLFAGVVSIVYNVIMYNLGQCAGKRNNSPALLANSFENRADAISSAAVVVGIAAAMLIHPVLDPVAALAVGVIIATNAISELRKSIGGLLDEGLPRSAQERIRHVTLAQPGIEDVTFIRTRPMGTNFWLDVGVQVDSRLSVMQSDLIVSNVRAELLKRSKHFHTVEIYVEPQPS